MADRLIPVRFFRLDSGREPVREWLLELDRESRKAIGEDIKTVQLAWPIGMPVVRKLDADLWEVRSRIPSGIARTLFTVRFGAIVLLHGFVKKAQKTPKAELTLAKRRLNQLGTK
jgi:phage-related protein